MTSKHRMRKWRLKNEVRKSKEKHKGVKDIDYVECEICKKRSLRIDIRHIRDRHNLTKEEYSEKFPDALLYCENYKKSQSRPNNKSNLGKKFSKEHREKISLARTNGVPWDERCVKEFKDYRAKVKYYTEKSYRKHYWKINPDDLKRGEKYHLDHIYPVKAGFNNNISAKDIAHYSNLRIISAIKNLKKADKVIGKCNYGRYSV